MADDPIPMPGRQTIIGRLLNIVAEQDNKISELEERAPVLPPMGQGIVGCEDVEVFFNMREWLREALEAKGAKQIGAGIGCGAADIDIELEGLRYNVTIRPLSK